MAVIAIANFDAINFRSNVDETYTEIVYQPPDFVFKSYLVEFAGGDVGGGGGGGGDGGTIGYPIG